MTDAQKALDRLEYIASNDKEYRSELTYILNMLKAALKNAEKVEVEYKADKYLHDLEHGRLSCQERDFYSKLLNPIFNAGVDHAEKVVSEVLKRCSLSSYEVDQIRIFFQVKSKAQGLVKALEISREISLGRYDSTRVDEFKDIACVCEEALQAFSEREG